VTEVHFCLLLLFFVETYCLYMLSTIYIYICMYALTLIPACKFRAISWILDYLVYIEVIRELESTRYADVIRVTSARTQQNSETRGFAIFIRDELDPAGSSSHFFSFSRIERARQTRWSSARRVFSMLDLFAPCWVRSVLNWSIS